MEEEMEIVIGSKADGSENIETIETARQNFLASYDFMKLGQALNHGNWQIAMVTVQRMQRDAQGLGFDTIERQLANVRQCIIHKQGRGAKDILALIVAKRAQLLKM